MNTQHAQYTKKQGDQHIQPSKGLARPWGRQIGNHHAMMTLFALCLFVCSALLNACSNSNTSSSNTKNGHQTTSFTSASGSSQPITYNSGPQDVLIRTFFGGGLYGSLELSPQISLYGDGTYILGADQQGKLSSDGLQQILHTVIDTYGLLNMQRQQFVDIQDQNATFLEIALNGKQKEYIYGSFGNVQESQQDMDEFHRLNKVLTAITEALKGPTHPYVSKFTALLARQTFTPDLSQNIPYWPLADYTLQQAAVFVCGIVPADDTSPNAETGCLKYLKPQHAILLTTTQRQTLSSALNGQQTGTFSEGGLYYTVFLRQLLPDELPKKSLAMFGSDQFSYSGVPLLEGLVPAVPTPTPSR